MTKHVLAFRMIGSNTDNPEGKKFSSKRAALRKANDWFFPANAQELADQSSIAPTGQMVKLYNSLAPTPVKKFADRKTAAERLWNLIEEQKMDDVVDPETLPENISERMAAQTANEKAQRDAKAAEAQRKKDEAAAAKEARAKERADKAAAKAQEKADKAAARAEAKAARDAAKAEKGPAKPRSALAGKVLVPIHKNGEGDLSNPRREGTFGHSSFAIILAAGAAGIKTEDFVAAGGRLVDANWDIDHGYLRVDEPAAE